MPFTGGSDPLLSQVGVADWNTTVAGEGREAHESARF
jgi:hypothetical protein